MDTTTNQPQTPPSTSNDDDLQLELEIADWIDEQTGQTRAQSLGSIRSIMLR